MNVDISMRRKKQSGSDAQVVGSALLSGKRAWCLRALRAGKERRAQPISKEREPSRVDGDDGVDREARQGNVTSECGAAEA